MHSSDDDPLIIPDPPRCCPANTAATAADADDDADDAADAATGDADAAIADSTTALDVGSLLQYTTIQ